MRAFGLTQPGGPEVLTAVDIPTPTLGAGDILIETMAVGLNNRERLTRQTAPAGPLTLPGADVAGIVRNLGADIANVAVGDRVVAHTSHAYAEWAVSRETDTVVLPSTVDFVTAASVVTTGITAYRAVTDYAHLRAGETLIVRGASGGVGNLIVQLAASLGVKVIGVASAAHQAAVLAAGAREFVAYDEQNVTAALRGRADVVINVAAEGTGADSDAALVTPAGRVVTVAHGTPRYANGIPITHLRPGGPTSDAAALGAIIALVAAGKLHQPIGQVLPFTLAGFRAGHRLLDAPPGGRIVISRAAQS